MLKLWQFLAIVLAGLATTMTFAHVLEMPAKMDYSLELYTRVNGTLYRYFAILGGAVQIGGIVASVVLAIMFHRSQSSFPLAITGAVLLVLAFVSWLALVQPVNREVAAAFKSAPATLPGLWLGLRPRWEYGHAVGFVLQLLGFLGVVGSVVRDTKG